MQIDFNFLQFFADGGSGSAGSATGGDGAGQGGNTGLDTGNGDGIAPNTREQTQPTSRNARRRNAYSNVVFGKQTETEETATGAGTPAYAANNDGDGTQPTADSGADAETEFEELIKGRFKDQFAKRTQKIIDKRFKESKTMQETLAKQDTLLGVLRDKYGVSDLEGLQKAMESDDSLIADMAAREGLSPQQYREFTRLRQQKAEADKAKAQSEAQKKVEEWKAEGEKIKAKYPSFNLDSEAQNPQFVSLLRAGVGVEAAYQALHMQELMSGAIARASTASAQRVTDNIRARANRPTENGVSGRGSGSVIKSDVSRLSKSDRAEVARRAMMGEKITF